MRTPTIASMALAACGLLTVSLMASAQTWVETHPAEGAAKGAARAQNAASAKLGAEIQDEGAGLRPDNGDEDRNRNDRAHREQGSLGRPDTASDESSRHE
jgi:hypothetical protein